MASGLYLRPGNQGRPAREQSLFPGTGALDTAAPAIPSHSPSDLTDPWQPRATETKSPYPGINIGYGSELLDFRFEDTEILQESEE
jgi:hypothetical protein